VGDEMMRARVSLETVKISKLKTGVKEVIILSSTRFCNMHAYALTTTKFDDGWG
jgi:hypothetical protein